MQVIRRAWLPISVVTLLVLTTGVVRRQLASDTDRKSGAQTQDDFGKERSSVGSQLLSSFPDGLEFERVIVLNAAFSATLIIESHLRMPDGSIRVTTSSSMIYRDSKGRTRRDWLPEATSSSEIAPKRSIINDPHSGFSYSLDHLRALARRTVFVGVSSPMSVASEQVANETHGNNQKLEIPSSSSVNRLHAATESTASESSAPRTESLGIRDMEGVLVEGTRASSTLHVPTTGDPQRIDIVAERWYAPSLQTVILIRRTDSRAGETVYRLQDIKLREPEATLFIVPRNYKIQNETGKEVSR